MCVYIVFPLIFNLNPSLSLSPLPPPPVPGLKREGSISPPLLSM